MCSFISFSDNGMHPHSVALSLFQLWWPKQCNDYDGHFRWIFNYPGWSILWDYYGMWHGSTSSK